MATSNSKLSREAEKDYRLKIKLERYLSRKMVAHFNWAANFAQNQFLQGNKSPKARPFIFDDMQKTLLYHYNKVGKQFAKKTDVDGVKLTKDELQQLFDDVKKAGKKHVGKSLPLILATLQDDIDNAVAEAGAKKDISKSKQAKLVRAKVRQSSLGRAKTTIPTTETQEPAEHSKFIAAIAINNSDNKPHKRQPIKTWVTVGDEKVRSAHQGADLQVKNSDDPFDVGGEQLMRPGDSSLGASPENVINCRCSAQYSFKQ